VLKLRRHYWTAFHPGRIGYGCLYLMRGARAVTDLMTRVLCARCPIRMSIGCGGPGSAEKVSMLHFDVHEKPTL